MGRAAHGVKRMTTALGGVGLSAIMRVLGRFAITGWRLMATRVGERFAARFVAMAGRGGSAERTRVDALCPVGTFIRATLKSWAAKSDGRRRRTVKALNPAADRAARLALSVIESS